jgi:hypothetical protein
MTGGAGQWNMSGFAYQSSAVCAVDGRYEFCSHAVRRHPSRNPAPPSPPLKSEFGPYGMAHQYPHAIHELSPREFIRLVSYPRPLSEVLPLEDFPGRSALRAERSGSEVGSNFPSSPSDMEAISLVVRVQPFFGLNLSACHLNHLTVDQASLMVMDPSGHCSIARNRFDGE